MTNPIRRSFVTVLVAGLLMPLAALAAPDLRMSTTTSTENSGLLAYLLPIYEAKTGTHIKVIAVGTGRALDLARNGDVDVTLVHARPAEDKFVAAGYGVNRRDVMYNDFIIVGPESDPAGIRGSHDVLKALKKLVDSHAKFISRGDNSGTDQMEHRYWDELHDKPAGSDYVSAGQGMGAVLNMAAEMQAYTLADRATYLAYQNKTGLGVMVEGDPRLFNPYGVIAVNPARFKDINYEGAMQFINWITSPDGQQRIAAFKINGRQVFFPSAH